MNWTRKQRQWKNLISNQNPILIPIFTPMFIGKCRVQEWHCGIFFTLTSLDLENCKQQQSANKQQSVECMWELPNPREWYLIMNPHENPIFVEKIFPRIFSTYVVKWMRSTVHVSCRTGSEVRIWDSFWSRDWSGRLRLDSRIFQK